MSSSFIPSFMTSMTYMTSMKSFNYNQLKNIKTELNPKALEFIPENIKKDDFKPCNNQLDENKDLDKEFDNLEKDFIKNNDWIFYM